MSACSCSFGCEILGGRISGPHIARATGHDCAVCDAEVKPGEACIDTAGIFADDPSGWFSRYHVLCFHLVLRFKIEVCDYEETWFPGHGDLSEMAQHAVAHGDEPFWRDWLLIYEMAWPHLPAIADEQPAETCEDCIRFTLCQRRQGITRFTLAPTAPCPRGFSFEPLHGKEDDHE